YEIRDVLGEGGYGKVYKVHHLDWDMDMAVKTPNEAAISRAGGVESFVRECHTWMDLGLHENIVTCHFVRVLGKVPRVFAEYVEGGTLSDWIETGKIYEESPEEVSERILDIAIQFARGLEYAHSRGMVHQDVKPANVLMTFDGNAKVSDFGLAGGALELPKGVSSEQVASVDRTFAGMTPRYASPEQAQAHAQRAAGVPRENVVRITPHSDLYSWAVSIFEIFNGGTTWPSGTVVGEAFREYLKTGPAEEYLPAMPESLVSLLSNCLHGDPAERPKSMSEVIENLKAIYGEETDREYSRGEPKQLAEMADVLNNKAASFLELDMPDEAEKLWEEALKIDPHHAEATYGLCIQQWRTARITDLEAIRRMEEVRTSHESDWVDDYLLGLIHLERGDRGTAVKILKETVHLSGKNTQVQKTLKQARTAGIPSCVRTLSGHTGAVYAVTISPDDRLALSGSSDNTIRLWDIKTGRCLQTLLGHSQTIHSVAFSSDSRFALSGAWDGTLMLWDINSGQCLCIFGRHSQPVYSVAFSSDDRFALSGAEDRTLRLWDVKSGECLRILKGHTAGVHSVAFFSDNRYALTGSFDQTLRLWDIGTGQCLRTFVGDTEPVHSIALSPNGRFAVSGAAGELPFEDNQTLALWDIETGRRVHKFEGHTSGVRSVAITSSGRFALSGSNDNTLRLWDIESGRCLHTLEGHTKRVFSVAISSDDRFALSGGNDDTLRLWTLTLGASSERAVLCRVLATATIADYESHVHDLASIAESKLALGNVAGAYDSISEAMSVPGYSKSAKLLGLRAKACSKGRIRAFLQGWHVRTFEGHTDSVQSVVFSSDNRFALSAGWVKDRTLRLWDLRTGHCLRIFKGGVQSVALSANGRLALSDASDCKLRLWDIETGHCLRTFKGHTETVNSVALSSDGRFAMSGAYDNTLRLWNIETGQCLRVINGESHVPSPVVDNFGLSESADNKLQLCDFSTGQFFQDKLHLKPGFTSIALSSDDRFALSGSTDKTLRLWDIRSGRCLRIFEGHRDLVVSASFSQDNHFALSVADKPRLWDVQSGRCLCTFEGNESVVLSIAFSSDRLFALSGSFDNALRLWEIETGRCLRTFEGHKEIVRSVAFSSDGRFALSGSNDNTLRLWELVWDYEFPEPADWDEGARPYLECFLTLQTPYAAELPAIREPTQEEITLALTRRGKPSWAEEDFENLLTHLSHCGYGWLRPEGVRKKLEEMTSDWHGPHSLSGT
ncbi:MAG: serine/threonine protein kinase, partial [Candidatus Abyssobacteria bacterium SURF_5]